MVKVRLILLVLQLSTAYDNLALNKPTWHLHPYHTDGITTDAGRAVDGLKSNLSIIGGQCVISNTNKQTATWRVDLEDILSIRHITIYYRTDGVHWDADNQYTGRFMGFSLYISKTTDRAQGELCFHDTNYTRATIPAFLDISCPFHGRYVIYYNERLSGVTYPSGYSQYAYNELCEVEVYGCPVPGYYGPDCSVPCPVTNCRYCHIETGACQGCKPGYQGLQCELPCSPYYYGEQCNETCGNCSNGMRCNNEDGTCPNGCDVGVYGTKCKTPCPDGSYGYNCLLTCVNCGRCNRFTGTCTYPCYPGWTGQNCTDECDGKKYGFACRYDCGACLDYKQCHHINGSCLQGCDAGFEGKFCKTVCTVGFYGINCQEKCSTNCEVSRHCNKTSGDCEGGCQPGWRGKLCDTKCGDNLYGPNCNQTCGKCREDKQCHHINGSCNGECKPGYRGDRCDNVCDFGYFGSSCKEECSVSCHKSRDCHHVTGYCRFGCKTGWYGNDCLQVDAQTLKAEPEEIFGTKFYGILCAFCVSLILHGVRLVYDIRKWNKTRLEKNKKHCASDSNICTKDTVLQVHKDERISSGYQELGELSSSSQYDIVN